MKEAKYLIGVGKIGKKLIFIVDIEELLNDLYKENITELRNKATVKI